MRVYWGLDYNQKNFPLDEKKGVYPMAEQQYSYLNPKIEMLSFPQKGTYGLFATQSIQKDELLAMWG